MKKQDIVELLKPMRQQGWYWDTDGKLKVHGHQVAVEDIPWLTNNLDFDCYLWNKIFHHGAAQQKMAHTHCHTCFKVVVSPRNFLELIELLRWQESSGLRCKCGIEVRDYVSRPYGGYFYSWEPGELVQMAWRDPNVPEGAELPVFNVIDDTAALAKGKEKYKLVKDGMYKVWQNYLKNWPDAPWLDDPMPVILKRGCTEFEQALGPTDKPGYRAISEEQLELERLIDEHVEYDHGMFVANQPPVIREHVIRRWAEFAHFIGDMTYVHYLGERLHPGPVVYHEEG